MSAWTSSPFEFDDRDFVIRRLSEAMKYGEKEMREDWNTAIALSQLMAVHEPLPYQEWQLESCMNRVLAYIAVNPEVQL